MSREGVSELLRTLLKQVELARKKTAKLQKKPELPVIGLRASDDDWQIDKTKVGYMVTGQKIERFARRTDFDSDEGVARLRDITRKMGILKELERQGIAPGQTITIGQPEIGRLEY
jgi:GTP-binding protein